MVGSDHFHQLWLDNMPQFLVGKAPFYDANYYNEEREFGLPRLLLKGHEELSAYILREGIDRGVRPGVLQRAAGRPLDHLPDLHRSPAERPADRADLHQHLRAAAAPARAVREARPDAPRADRRVAVGPAGRRDRHRPPVAGARRPAPVRAARAGPGVRRPGGASGSPTATSTAAWPRSRWTACTRRATPPTASWTSC